jgi:hypothetical protein
VPETQPGVYVVARTDQPSRRPAPAASAPLDRRVLKELLAVRPELRIDGRATTAKALAARLDAFWLSGEPVLYVGLAGQPLRTRVRQYYRTPIGARRPHAGGWWLKTLGVLDELWVFWAPTPDFERAEKAMLRAFAGGVSERSAKQLHDPNTVMPLCALMRPSHPRRLAQGTAACGGHLAVLTPCRMSGACLARRAQRAWPPTVTLRHSASRPTTSRPGVSGCPRGPRRCCPPSAPSSTSPSSAASCARAGTREPALTASGQACWDSGAVSWKASCANDVLDVVRSRGGRIELRARR